MCLHMACMPELGGYLVRAVSQVYKTIQLTPTLGTNIYSAVLFSKPY